MKIYDFDAKFYEYVRVQMSLQPKLTEDEVEGKYNEMLQNWLNAPATWLNGEKPGEYFRRYEAPADLIKLLEEYMKRDYDLPEPLYRRIVEVGAPCVPGLARIAADADRKEALRATAIALLRDIEADPPVDVYMDLVCGSEDSNELGEMACEALKKVREAVAEPLLARYDAARPYGRMMILDICSGTRLRGQVYDRLLKAVMTQTEQRGYYASLLADVGDERAIEPLKQVAAMADLDYLDYIEVREAIERLGGDPGDLRDFNGDPAYEALRNL